MSIRRGDRKFGGGLDNVFYLDRGLPGFEFDPDKFTAYEENDFEEFAPGITVRGQYTFIDDDGSARVLPVVSFSFLSIDIKGQEDTLERLVVLQDEGRGEYVDLENQSHLSDYYIGSQIGWFNPSTLQPEAVCYRILKTRRFYEVCIYGGSKGDSPVLHIEAIG